MLFDVHVVPQNEFSDWATKTGQERQALNADSYGELNKQSVPKDKMLYRLTDPELFQGIATQTDCAGAGAGARRRRSERPMLGKLTWAAIPFDQPIPLVAGAVVLVAILAVLVWVVVKGHLPYLWR